MGHSLFMLISLIGLTHAFRCLARWAGPRWGGLVLGLPCMSALALAGTGVERGLDDALGMAETGLLGLAASVMFPVAYMKAVRRGWGTIGATLAGLLGYSLVALVCATSGLVRLGVGSLLPLALAAVLLAWHWVTPIRGRIRSRAEREGEARRSRMNIVYLRTLVPVLCMGTVMLIREFAGARWAGMLAPFPGLTLTMLVLTHVEAGPAAVCRMARTLPPSNLSMVAFFGACRLVGPGHGLFSALLLGYSASLMTLFLVERLTRRPGEGLVRLITERSKAMDHHPWVRMAPIRFAPCFEVL